MPIHYSARVVGDAYEYTMSVAENLDVIRDSMKYNGKILSLDDYIDDTYSARVYNYDMDNLTKSWNSLYENYGAYQTI